MISKITDITGNGHYDHPTHGRLFKFLYSFEDGTEVSANHKTDQPKFKVGDEAEYTVKGSNSYGSWGAVEKPGGYTKQPTGGGGEDRGEVIERSWAFKCAIQMLGPCPSRDMKAKFEYLKEACELAQAILFARDSFPKLEADVLNRASVDGQMAGLGENPFLGENPLN
tara:strand:- start:496 stop:999 length:504 start_codon:yes stop_codon:yes gene_type:complete